MRLTLVLELDLIETDTIEHDSGSPYDIVRAINQLGSKEGFLLLDAQYKFESAYSPNTLTKIKER